LVVCLMFHFHSIKPGKVVLLLNGRFAGRKAVIVKAYDPKRKRQYPHCLVAGIDKYPLKITKKMPLAKMKRRCRVQPFIKFVNLSHVMPTRYTLDMTEELQKAVKADKMEEGLRASGKMKREVKRLFEQRYNSGKNRWFFTKLRF